MTRYYYTDPLAAAWMAKHFGMRLQKANFGYGEGTIDIQGLLDAEMDKAWKWRYYIHPDSLHLLEPMVGDVVDYFRPDTTMTEMHHWFMKYREPEHRHKTKSDDCSYRIIQRNGIAFMWPESEEV